MSIKIFGVLITTNSILKAVESGAIDIIEAAVSALANSDDPDAKAVAAAVKAKIDELEADTTKTGLEKLEEAALDALQILGTYGFEATKDFAIALVQTLFNQAKSELSTIAHAVLTKLGIEKD